jgi:putative toxin-antitoxin system antitoxin component (TIGR02293 family)
MMELDAVVEIMGGQEAIGRKVNHAADIIEISAKGMPSKVIQAIQDHGNFSNKQISILLDIPESTLQRSRKSAKTLKKDDAEKAFHLSSVLAKGISVLGDEEKFHQWLNLENEALGGIKPLAWLNSSIGREEILRLLHRIEYGIYS